ncbi:flagellin [Metabacillus herbersteinensis]|uniref:Flagellin n=1 Tax=Metabacillus herbersteinensis TaxID=283816 RepID=A0ABV6GEV7_9BACI
MRINHNIAALNTHRQLSSASANQSKSMEKLSSGLRINRAGDDAAGLAISEKMRGQIRGLDMGSKNAQDGISLIQTAEGALNETHDILQRMRELAVQSSNDTNTSSDRSEIQKEIDQLNSEIDRIGNTTEFNTKKLLNGEVGVNAYSSDLANVKNVTAGSDTTSGTYTITATALATTTNVDSSTISLGDNLAASGTLDGTRTLSSLAAANGTASITVNGKTFSFDSSKTIDDIKNEINASSGQTGVTADFAITSAADGTADDITWSFTATQAGSAGAVAVTGATEIFGGTYSATVTGADATFTATGIDENSVAISGLGTASNFEVKGNTVTYKDGAAEGLKFELAGTTATTVSVNDDNVLSFQIGANEGQTMNVAVQDMRSSALGINNLDVKTTSGANTAISTINTAIETVSAERSKLGAYQNRLEHTINNLNTSSENLTAAESRVRDVDMAKEMMTQTKNSILSQAAQAMLAQSNQMPQGVLQLLR